MKRLQLPAACLILSACCMSATIGGLDGAEPELPPSGSVKPSLYATGFAFAKAPATSPSGDLFVANYRRSGTIGRIGPDGTAEIFHDLRDPESTEHRQPEISGLVVDAAGRLVATDFGTGRLLRISADGSSHEILADRWEEKRFSNLANVALDGGRNIYFTDMGDPDAEQPTGSVYRYAAKTSKVTQLATGLAFPIGLAVTADNRHLYIGESENFRVLVFDLARTGKLTNCRVLIDFPKQTKDTVWGGEFKAGGMVFDQTGRLYVAMAEGGIINVIETPSGRLIRQYSAGGRIVTGCDLHGGYLYAAVVDKEAVFRMRIGSKRIIHKKPAEEEDETDGTAPDADQARKPKGPTSNLAQREEVTE